MIGPVERRFVRLEKARSELETELALLSSGQLAFKPRHDAWSIGEVLDHIVRVESSVLEGASRPGVKRDEWRPRPLRRAITWLVFAMGVRIRVPQRVTHVTPEAGAHADEAIARWSSVRADLRRFLDSIPAGQVGHLAIKHPIAGPFSYGNFLSFLEWHLKHHRRQIGRIRRSPDFPH